MDKTNRKTDIPIKPTGVIGWILDNATGEQLDYMDSIAKSSNFKIFGKIISNLRDYNAYSVFNCAVKSAEDLEYYRLRKKGEVDGLFDFAKACQLAGTEIERRRSLKENGSA